MNALAPGRDLSKWFLATGRPPVRGRPGPSPCSGRRRRRRRTAPSTAAPWPAPISTAKRPPGSKDAQDLRAQAAIGVQAVRAAVERQARLVIADLRRQGRDLGGGDIGRIGDHQIEAVGASPPSSRRAAARRARRGRGWRRSPAPPPGPPPKHRRPGPGRRALGQDRQQDGAGADAEIEHGEARSGGRPAARHRGWSRCPAAASAHRASRAA